MAYEDFYREGWKDVYSFWHQIINRGEKQIDFLIEWLMRFPDETIRILDLGCGEGDEIAKAISNVPGKRFEIWANDTSEEAMGLYQKNLGLYVEKTFLRKLEELPEKIIGEKFDLILFSHSLYSIELDGLFEEYFGLLNESGQLVVFMDALENEFKQIQVQFWKEVHGTNFFDDENVAETIKDRLCSINGVYLEAFPFDYDIDIGELIQINPDGVRELFVPFAMRVKSEKLGEDVKSYISFFIETIAKNGKLKGRAMIITVRKEHENENSINSSTSR